MTDIVERLRWWGAKRRPPRNMPTLPADCAEAANEIERLQTELDHFYALAVDDPGKNPPTFWKDRVAGLEKALERQGDNMAFVINHVTIPNQWMEKFMRELEEDRAALESVRGLSTPERKVNE